MRPAQKFAGWLRERVGEEQHGARLPTDREMARMFGISTSTVRRAIARYRADGTICRIPGKGTFVGQPTEAEAPAWSPPKSSAETIASHLRDAVHSGTLRRGHALPPVKQMVYRFKVAPATVQQAYRRVERSGLVVRIGRSYFVGALQDALRPGTAADIALFCRRAGNFGHLFKTDHLAQAYCKMERELLANGFTLRFEVLSELEQRVRAWRRRKRLPQGFLLYLMGEPDFEAYRGAWTRIVGIAEALGQPAPRLLLDGLRKAVPRRPRATHVISRGNILTTVARTLARYLVAQRWREACFFAEPDNVSTIPCLAKIRAELTHLDPDFVCHFVAVPEDPGKATTRELAQKLAASFADPTTAPIVAKYEKIPVDVLRRETVVLKHYADVRARFPQARMWVLPTDAHAAAALAWATGNGVQVPKDLSIISSEHDPDFYHLGLTCCFPDYEQIGYQMAHALIGDPAIARTSKGFLRTNALLVDQLTTRVRD